MHRPGPASKLIGLGPNETGPAEATRLETDVASMLVEVEVKYVAYNFTDNSLCGANAGCQNPKCVTNIKL